MDDTRLTAGAAGEEAAWRLYERRGYRLVARNWRCGVGELDLVMRRAGVLVFCEVKARRGGGFGGGWEAVTARKQAKLRAVAEAYLLATRVRVPAVRFDVASVVLPPGGGPGASAQVEVFEDAF